MNRFQTDFLDFLDGLQESIEDHWLDDAGGLSWAAADALSSIRDWRSCAWVLIHADMTWGALGQNFEDWDWVDQQVARFLTTLP